MYLTRDHIGAASGVVYGLKGDFVKVIKQYSEGFMTCELNDQKFLVHVDYLSEEKPDGEKVVENIQPLHKASRRRR